MTLAIFINFRWFLNKRECGRSSSFIIIIMRSSFAVPHSLSAMFASLCSAHITQKRDFHGKYVSQNFCNLIRGIFVRKPYHCPFRGSDEYAHSLRYAFNDMDETRDQITREAGFAISYYSPSVRRSYASSYRGYGHWSCGVKCTSHSLWACLGLGVLKGLDHIRASQTQCAFKASIKGSATKPSCEPSNCANRHNEERIPQRNTSARPPLISN